MSMAMFSTEFRRPEAGAVNPLLGLNQVLKPNPLWSSTQLATSYRALAKLPIAP
jgi:hypothetical protein